MFHFKSLQVAQRTKCAFQAFTLKHLQEVLSLFSAEINEIRSESALMLLRSRRSSTAGLSNRDSAAEETARCVISAVELDITAN